MNYTFCLRIWCSALGLAGGLSAQVSEAELKKSQIPHLERHAAMVADAKWPTNKKWRLDGASANRLQERLECWHTILRNATSKHI